MEDHNLSSWDCYDGLSQNKKGSNDNHSHPDGETDFTVSQFVKL